MDDRLTVRTEGIVVTGGLLRRKYTYTSGLTRYRVSLSWAAAVFLPAVAVVVAATALALFKG